jgi:hypothetical protein
MQSKTEKTGELILRGTDGKNYRVLEFTEFWDATTIHDSHRKWTPGALSYKLPNGESVNLLSDGNYQIVRTGLILKPI